MQHNPHDTAQVCLNGHVITSMADTAPQFRKPYCTNCGATTIMSCPACEAPIRGRYKASRAIREVPPPSFCHDCGEPYPWTERALAAATELVDLVESMPAPDRQALKERLPALMSDTPQTKVAVARMQQWLAKAGPKLGLVMRDLIVNIGTEAVKKVLLP